MMQNSRNGFSLIELSIVLVILGLLVGGILAGQSLIRASELRGAATEYQRYVSAVHAFRDKYFAIPGDMRTATSFWGDDATACSDPSITNGSPGTCNGDGNGAVLVNTEQHRFWQHLSLAQMIEGTYTGVPGPNGNRDEVFGVTCPKSKVNNAGWSAVDMGNYAGDANTFAYSYGNIFSFGAWVASQWALGRALKPEEAWNFDAKLDDGMPGSGRIVAFYRSACANAGSATDYAATYTLNTATLQCALYFPRAF